MLTKLFISLLSLNGALVSAFPDIAERLADQGIEEQFGEKLAERAALAPFPEYPGDQSHAAYNKFNAKQQRVSTSGVHKFIPPGKNDIRGPCAGLNAAANHGYLPRNGIATAESINTGLQEAYGLDKTATLFLQAATMFFDGDPVTGKWSIGRAAPKQTNSFGTLLGAATGICEYGHLKTEADSSITRGDWLAPTMNDNCHSYPRFAQELLNLAKRRTGGNLTPRVMAEHQYNRHQHSIATNPNYFSPAYAGVAFTFGAHMFAYELLANHSSQYPRGILTPEVFMSFFSYTKGADGQLIQTDGHERIPENWYKRADDDMWTLNDIVQSTAQQCASYPSNCAVGGNTGKVNSFQGVNPGDATGGFLNSFSDLSDPQKAGCFISQAIQADAPGFLDKAFTGVILAQVKALIPTKLIPALTGLGPCQNLPKGKTVTQYGNVFPGAKIQQSGPRSTS